MDQRLTMEGAADGSEGAQESSSRRQGPIYVEGGRPERTRNDDGRRGRGRRRRRRWERRRVALVVVVAAEAARARGDGGPDDRLDGGVEAVLSEAAA